MKRVPKSFQAVIITILLGMFIPKIVEITGAAFIDKIMVKGLLSLSFSIATICVGGLFSAHILRDKVSGGKTRILLYLIIAIILLSIASTIVSFIQSISNVILYVLIGITSVLIAAIILYLIIKAVTAKKEFKTTQEKCIIDGQKNNYELIPMTIEGCIVRISDVIGYIGKDIEDAMRLKVIAERDIPEDIKRVLGTKNSEIMNSIILDIIENSFNKPYISMSDTVYRAIDKLKDFNMKNIYMKANTKEDVERYTRIFNELFDVYLVALNNSKKSNNIYETFLNNKNKEYVLNNKKEQIIVDYLSGMTDRFIESEYERYVK